MHISVRNALSLLFLVLTQPAFAQETVEDEETSGDKPTSQIEQAAAESIGNTCSKVLYGELVNESIEDEDEKEDAIASSQEACFGIEQIYSLSGVDSTYLDLFLDIMRPISQQKKLDADAVWKASRSIMRMFDTMKSPEGMDKAEFAEFRDNIRENANDLLEISYTDRFHRNENLSYQVSTRLVLLVKDALKLASTKNISHYYAEDFETEFGIFTDRYVGEARFSAGIGLSMNYIPKINYRESTRIGFDTLQSEISGGADRLSYTGIFENDNYIAPSIVLGTPYFKVNAIFPGYSDETQIVMPVRQRSIDGIEGDVFYQTTVTSSLDIEYDINLAISARDYLIMWFDYKPFLQQFDYGVGAGYMGVKVKSIFDTDIKVREEGEDPFVSLNNTMSLKGGEERSYMIPYFKAYADFVFAKTWVGGISVKYFFDDSDAESRIDVGGYNVSLDFHWFPTIIN